MAGVYFYVPTYKIQDIIDCGIKLSEWYDREIELCGQTGVKRAIGTLVNPRDDHRSKDDKFKCIRLEVNPDQCMVGDSVLYQLGLHNSGIMQRYLQTLVPLSQYRFGVFRNPECLVFTSILPDSIEVTGKVKDIPILFESSEVLYLGNQMEKIEQVHQDSGNILLYTYCSYLESIGRLTKEQNSDVGVTVFFDKENGDYVVTQTPK